MFDFVFVVGSDAFEATDRDGLFIDASATTRRLARTIACATKDSGKHIRIPVDHVRLGVLTLGD
jgi:hypothetical protein